MFLLFRVLSYNFYMIYLYIFIYFLFFLSTQVELQVARENIEELKLLKLVVEKSLQSLALKYPANVRVLELKEEYTKELLLENVPPAEVTKSLETLSKRRRCGGRIECGKQRRGVSGSLPRYKIGLFWR